MADIIETKTLIIAIIGGLLPALFWLWFWLREDSEHPEPKLIVALTFILGMITVVIVVPIQRYFSIYITDEKTSIIVLSSIEELAKFAIAYVSILRSRVINEPIDYAIYMVTIGLGFAALENILYLIYPISGHDTVVGLLTGHLRYLGSTLLHAITSALIGISLGLSFGLKRRVRLLYCLVGIGASITLHSIFNFFIMKDNGTQFIQVFGFLWVVTIISILLFEKLRRMSHDLAQ
jgi:RsiW-degrading membrane proteinase PrsW (M82 family)